MSYISLVARAMALVATSEVPKLHRKHPPVSGGKRPLCTLGVPPGRSRGIGGCARAPCVFLAAAEGMA
eukprot:scaffold68268_cov76-Phaeocystis_antarctica.AAC.4